MITTFLNLDFVNEIDNVFMYLCTLPDPDIDTEDRYLPCGFTRIHFNRQLQLTEIDVYLNSLFIKLCMGESYQRRDFVFTILFLLDLSRYCEDYSNIVVNIKDNWGTYTGPFSKLDESCWSIEE